MDYKEVERLGQLFLSNGSMQEWSSGDTAMLLWDQDQPPDDREIRVEGQDLIAVLYWLRDHYGYQVRDAREALKQHGIGNEALSVPDSIHLLVGRKPDDRQRASRAFRIRRGSESKQDGGPRR